MRLFGLVLLLLGIVIFCFGISSSQAITEKVVEGVSGRYTSTTMWYIIGGIVLVLGGTAVALYDSKK